MAGNGKLQQEIKDAVRQSPEIAALEARQPKFTSLADAEKSASQHEDNSEVDDAMGCEIRVLTAYPADKDFPHHYWQLARFAEWDMRASPSTQRDAFFFQLAELGAQLPPDSAAYSDVRLLHAKVFEKRGRPKEADKIYEAMLNQKDRAEGFTGAIALRGGRNCEQMGNYAKALTYYKAAEDLINTSAQCQEAVLRAAYIQFDDNNLAEANRLGFLLASAVNDGGSTDKPTDQATSVASLLIDTSVFPANWNISKIAKLLAGTTNKPPPYWNDWHAWWPQWESLAKAAGLAIEKGRKIIPDFSTFSDLYTAADSAAQNGDRKQLFEILRNLVYAARLYPEAALKSEVAFGKAEELMPEHATDLYNLSMAMIEPIVLATADDTRMRILDLLADYIDTGKEEKALGLMKAEWKPALDNGSTVALGIHRLWGNTALRLGKDLDRPIAALWKPT